MMGSTEVESCVDEGDFSLTKNEVGFFIRDKSDLGKVTYAPEVGEYTRVGRDVSTTV